MRRRIMACLYQGKNKKPVWTRYYNWMDTAMPRAVQLALCSGHPGDVVEFSSTELGFQIGVLHLMPGNKIELEYSSLVAHSPTLLKLTSK